MTKNKWPLPVNPKHFFMLLVALYPFQLSPHQELAAPETCSFINQFREDNNVWKQQYVDTFCCWVNL